MEKRCGTVCSHDFGSCHMSKAGAGTTPAHLVAGARDRPTEVNLSDGVFRIAERWDDPAEHFEFAGSLIIAILAHAEGGLLTSRCDMCSLPWCMGEVTRRSQSDTSRWAATSWPQSHALTLATQSLVHSIVLRCMAKAALGAFLRAQRMLGIAGISALLCFPSRPNPTHDALHATAPCPHRPPA